MLRVTIAVVLSAVVQFAWGFAFWSQLSGKLDMMRQTPDEAGLAKTIKEALPESGTYFLPNCPGADADEAAQKGFEARHEAGPLVEIRYRKEGYSMAFMPVIMGIGFGHMVVMSLLAAILLRMALPGLETYVTRVLFVFGLGVFAVLLVHGGDLIWFHRHWAFPTGQMLFGAVGWLLSGAVMAAIIRPAATQAQAVKHTYKAA